jgi:hypothetical protein
VFALFLVQLGLPLGERITCHMSMTCMLLSTASRNFNVADAARPPAANHQNHADGYLRWI